LGFNKGRFMMRHVGAVALGILSIVLPATQACADNWNVYIPPPPASTNPPPFSTSSWVFVKTVSDDDAVFGDPCGETAMGLHYEYWNSGDRDSSMRALHAVCVDQKNGAVVDSTKSP
jgi:hypothetical protein